MSFNKLYGLFAAHKPAGITCSQLIGTLKTSLLKDLNASQKLYLPTFVEVKQLGKEASNDDKERSNENQLWKVEEKKDLRFHPLVAGPYFNRLNVQVVSGGLDKKSSGVLVLSIGRASRYIPAYQDALLPRQYHVNMQLGYATNDYDAEGKVIVKSTYRHISREKFDRVVTGLTKTSRRYNSNYSGLDMQSQEAYDIAVAGKLESVTLFNQPTIITAKCLHFNPPYVSLEMECLNEDSDFIRDTINSLGIKLKSSAVTSRINRTKDGPFTMEHSILRKHWTLTNIAQCVKNSKEMVKPFIKRKDMFLDELTDEQVKGQPDVQIQ
ncbi:pseudouridylate synthase TRUB2, mitochondrial-like [Antedon mediterranea]|uniref:pseudouridylate synthase TRUB2, mitochondrial-like n=1 Tax=Antedon mediterranea TaxID=105859 RepID=UPI003AF438C4